MTTIKDILADSTAKLSGHSDTARLDAELLVAHVLGMSRSGLIAHHDEQVDPNCIPVIEKLLKRRIDHEPVAYIVGYKEFYGLDFVVTPDVLIPRPETELLVERGLELLEQCEDPLLVLDCGTGSGCLAIVIAKNLSDKKRAYQVYATDISEAALEVARTNAKKHKVNDSIKFIESNWFSSLKNTDKKFDLIVSNPPYVAEGSMDTSPEIKFEPEGALYSGRDGLEALRMIIESVSNYLKPGGTALIEIGSDQGRAVSELAGALDQSCVSYQIKKDLAGHDRMLELLRVAE
ncbi:MAG: peptide chain release factor N(5)-glutamine methyltransferase [Candidatus Dadabacteria bacterium]|nr:MAG: peptide chain release factor N(5)-glutamine methyltransferase [Candidatus Dadabacteria bacterium]